MIRDELKKNYRLYLFIAAYLIVITLAVNWPDIARSTSVHLGTASAKAQSAASSTPATYQNAHAWIERVAVPKGWTLTESPDKSTFGFVTPDKRAAIVGLAYPENAARNLESLFTSNEAVLRQSGQAIESHSTEMIGGREWIVYQYQTTAAGHTMVNRDAITQISTRGPTRFIKMRLVSDADVFEANVPVLDSVMASLVFSK